MIAVNGVELIQGSFRLRDISFSVPEGSYAVLMGRTGAGKTTLLEAICGLRKPKSGSVYVGGIDVTNATPAQRRIGYVPQDRALFSTMTVREHLGFSLEIRSWPKLEVIRRIDELAELLGLRDLMHRKPARLSGGESQRVALGRALASKPPVLCLDEPLSALDDETREEMYALLKTIRQHTGVTTLHVTHHRNEAERLGDVILLMENGTIRV